MGLNFNSNIQSCNTANCGREGLILIQETGYFNEVVMSSTVQQKSGKSNALTSQQNMTLILNRFG